MFIVIPKHTKHPQSVIREHHQRVMVVPASVVTMTTVPPRHRTVAKTPNEYTEPWNFWEIG